MKNKITLIYFLLTTTVCFSQTPSAFDKALSDISSDLAKKLNAKSKKQIVVLYVTDINKSTTVAGKYLADIISTNLVNDSGNFGVFDRDNLNEIASAKKLIAEGYIDVEKAKELGKLLSVEAIIVGNYTVLSNTIKLTMKALDSNNGLVIAASMKDLPLNSDAGVLLGINVAVDGGNNNSNRGFNGSPLNSGEQYNNPETVNKECENKNTGDYCFTNNSKYNVTVTLFNSNGNGIYYNKEMTLSPSQTQCFYSIPVSVANYAVRFLGINDSNHYQNTNNKRDFSQGQINIEKCKSKSLTITY